MLPTNSTRCPTIGAARAFIGQSRAGIGAALINIHLHDGTLLGKFGPGAQRWAMRLDLLLKEAESPSNAAQTPPISAWMLAIQELVAGAFRQPHASPAVDLLLRHEHRPVPPGETPEKERFVATVRVPKHWTSYPVTHVLEGGEVPNFHGVGDNPEEAIRNCFASTEEWILKHARELTNLHHNAITRLRVGSPIGGKT